MFQWLKKALFGVLTRQEREAAVWWQDFRRKNPGWPGLVKGCFCLLANRLPGFSKTAGWSRENNPARLLLRESGRFQVPSTRSMMRRLMEFDVISFDVFDTLLLRPVEEPADLFYFVGLKLSCPDFRALRIRAEEEARRRNRQAGGCGEVTLEEIWEVLSAQTGIDRGEGMLAEWETERQFCYANPRFLPVLAALRRAGKQVVIASDMYLGEERIRRLLLEAGLGVFDRCFVSCDRNASKGQGTLFDVIRLCFGSGCRWIHVGDDAVSDGEKARKRGVASLMIPSARLMGYPFRIRRMSPVVGSMYRGLASQRMHGRGRRYSPLYEFGYLYGGLWAVGFCRFLHRKVQEKRIDRLLFLARDGEIVRKVYQLLYPDSDTRYVYWSRRVALKLSADVRRQEFFRRFLRDKINRGYTAADCFASMDLSGLLASASRDTGLDEKTPLTAQTAEAYEVWLQSHFPLVLEIYRQEMEAAEEYLAGMLAGCSRAAAVDIGWLGTGPWALAHVAGKVCPNTTIHTFLAASAPRKNGDFAALYPELFTGQVETYLFSPVFNRRLWEFHDPVRGDNLVMELLAASPSPTFLGFARDAEGNVQFRFGNPEPQSEKIRRIQQGIWDFASDWKRHFGGLKGQEISGRDAYAPIRAVLSDAGYRKKLEQYFSWETSMFVE